jgi:L-histidine N-alpha-methyltransferase
MKPTNRAIRRPDLSEGSDGNDVLAGLRAPRKHLPCRLLYDARGAQLFEQICTVDEYYPYRSELALLDHRLPDVATAVGAAARVIEPGSGAGLKTRMLLSALDRPAVYVPIDVSAEQLTATAERLGAEFPTLDVLPIAGDYNQSLTLPPARHAGRTLVFFPGSTIGNFEPDEARAFLSRFAALAGPDALLVLGADSNHTIAELLAAYDDAAGVTAAFDLNVLAHLNRIHGATFDLAAFMHRAVWDSARSRIEMHLVSRRRQVVHVFGESFQLERGEPIVTEHCYKHTPDAIKAILDDAGWRVRQVFADPLGRMRLWLGER